MYCIDYFFHQRIVWIKLAAGLEDRSMNEWMNRWINEWMNEWMNEWIKGWMNGLEILYDELKELSWLNWWMMNICVKNNEMINDMNDWKDKWLVIRMKN